jgi:hypothetical protein
MINFIKTIYNIFKIKSKKKHIREDRGIFNNIMEQAQLVINNKKDYTSLIDKPNYKFLVDFGNDLLWIPKEYLSILKYDIRNPYIIDIE